MSLSKVIYINEQDYSTLLNAGTITKNGTTYRYDATALYVIKDVGVPEYADEAGYAVNAGTAQAAIYDSGGNNILETYATKKDTSGVGNVFYGVGNISSDNLHNLQINPMIEVEFSVDSQSDIDDFFNKYVDGHYVPTLIMDLSTDITIPAHSGLQLKINFTINNSVEESIIYKITIDVENKQNPIYGNVYVVVPESKLKAGQYILALEENIYSSKTWRLISSVNPVISLLDLIDTFN